MMHSRLKIRILADHEAVSPQVAFVCVKPNIKTIEDLSAHICSVFDIRPPVSLYIEKTFLPPRETIHVIFPADIVDVKLDAPEPETGSEAADVRRKSFNDRLVSVEEEVPPPKRKKVKRAKESLETLPQHCHLSAEPDSPPTTDGRVSVEEEVPPPKKKKLKRAKESDRFETLPQHCHLSAEPDSPPTTDKCVNTEEEDVPPVPKRKKLKKAKGSGELKTLPEHSHLSAEPDSSPPITEGNVDDSWKPVKKKRKRKHKKRGARTAEPNLTPSQDQISLFGHLKGQYGLASSTWREETTEQLEETAEQLDETTEQLDETAEQLEETAEQLDETAAPLDERAEQLDETAAPLDERAEQLDETAEQLDETAEQLGGTAEDYYSGHQMTSAITGTSRNQSPSSSPTIEKRPEGDSEKRVRRKRVRKHKKKQPTPITQGGGEEGAETGGIRKTEGVESRGSFSSNQHNQGAEFVEGLPQAKDLLQTDCAGEEEGRSGEEVARPPLSTRTAELQEKLTNGVTGGEAEETKAAEKKWIQRKSMNQMWRETRRLMLSSLPPQLLVTGSDRRSESQSRVATSPAPPAQIQQLTSATKKSKPLSQNGDKSSSYQPCLCDFIMFKRLKIGENYCPEPSNPITAFVRQINEDGSLKLEVIDGLDEFREPTGKFSMDADSQEEESLSSTVVLNVSDLIDPRKVVYPPTE